MHDSVVRDGRSGWIEVIVGSMFSGKTEELMRLLRRAQYARQPYQLFKPKIDDRYSADHVASHNQNLMPAITIDNAADIFYHLKLETKVVGIDEGQFFDEDLVDVCNELADRGIRVIVAGLDVDWKGEPFEPMPALMAIAEIVKKQHAVCVVCGSPASRTQRRIVAEDIAVGGASMYEARCRSCYDPMLGRSEFLTESAELIEETKAHELAFE